MNVNMSRKLVFRTRTLLLCICLLLPVLAILSQLASSTATWMIAAMLLWACLLGVTVANLVNLKRLERLIGALRDGGLSEAEIEALLNKRIELP